MPSRRPVRYVVGIDIGGTNIVAGTVAEDGSELLGLVSEPTFPEQGADYVVGLTIGTGIGGGIVLGGQVYRGASDIAGEIGHMTIDSTGRLCKCGNYGCLEAYASGPAIAARAVEGIRPGADTSLPTYVNGHLPKITAQVVYE